MMIINIEAAIDSPNTPYHVDYDGPLDTADERELKAYVKDVHVSLDYLFNEKEQAVYVYGSLSTVLHVACDRCLKEMEYPFSTEFSEVLKQEAGEDDECYLYSGDVISMDKILLDQFSLKLPAQFLCREDCLGLCPKCGKDLNEGPCACGDDEEENESPFSGLKGLFGKNEEV